MRLSRVSRPTPVRPRLTRDLPLGESRLPGPPRFLLLGTCERPGLGELRDDVEAHDDVGTRVGRRERECPRL